MKIYIAHSSNFNFKENLYEPIKKSKIFKNNSIYLPHDNNTNCLKSKEIIRESDLIIADVSMPSIGLGIELGWAEDVDIPILCIYKQGYEYSSSLKFITNNFIEYFDEKDMINKLEKNIKKLKNK